MMRLNAIMERKAWNRKVDERTFDIPSAMKIDNSTIGERKYPVNKTKNNPFPSILFDAFSSDHSDMWRNESNFER